MGKTVILQQKVRECLENLIQILFENDYFGFEESAQIYVSKIYDFIEFDIINFPYKIFPEKLKHLGTKYAFYKANENTTWYIFLK
ncbi:MAG: hypothetical protein GX159_05545 [Flavobacteriaceae bacterium]|nr:hypothetical protein [Flavobacteriaceae bacterium]